MCYLANIDYLRFMLAAAKNYDVICLQMRNYLAQQEGPIKHETNRFVDGVREIINSGDPIKPKLDKFLPQVFNYRLMALKWISQQPDIDFSHLIEKAYPSLEGLRKNPKLAVLAENTLFALRCNARVTHAVIGETNSEEFSKQLASVPVTTYEQFFGTLVLSIPDQEAFQTIADFTNTSLYIEFILLAAILINEESLDVAENTTNELAFLIADAAQEYSAVATQMGILPARKHSESTVTGGFVDSSEDQLLSNLGLPEFAKNF